MHENEKSWACHKKYVRVECAIKGIKEFEHATKRMRASTRKWMIIQCCMGVQM
jgi:hypothetical protein